MLAKAIYLEKLERLTIWIGGSSIFLNFMVFCPLYGTLTAFIFYQHRLFRHAGVFDLACLQAATLKIVIGSHIWLEDKDLAWIDGEVFRIEGQNVHVHTTNGKTVCVSDVACCSYMIQ